MERFNNWCLQNHLQVSFVSPETFMIEGAEGTYLLVSDDGKKQILNEKFELIFTHSEEKHLKYVNKVVFPFGGNFYITNPEGVAKLTPFKYLGTSSLKNIELEAYLGIHGAYEICVGTGTYKDWCKKAKFLGYKYLGISETHTLGGTLAFVGECKDAGIKPIIGESIKVVGDYGVKEFSLKLFVTNDRSWRALLNINSYVNVHNHGFIRENELLPLLKDLIVVFEPDSLLDKDVIRRLKANTSYPLYYNFEVNEWDSFKREEILIDNHHNYLDNYYSEDFLPVFTSDAYFIEPYLSHTKKIVNKIGEKGSYTSEQQFLKSEPEFLSYFLEFFKNEKVEEFGFNLFHEIVRNTNGLVKKCEFELKSTQLYLPEYEMTPIEMEMYNNNEYLFHELINDGLDRLVEEGCDRDTYRKRLDIEIDVISRGGFIDYFLILWDIVNFCKANNIQTGIGRGSAAGCLVSYILGIVQADPIKFDLLFERFLNESRIKGGLPDIDFDVEASKRDMVKDYLREKYGHDYVVAIGTYTTFQLRGSLKDVGKAYGLEHSYLNYITGMVNPGTQTDNFDLNDLFQQSLSNVHLKDFLKQNSEVIEDIPNYLETPKTQSIHAAGTIILPKMVIDGKKCNAFDLLPVRKMNGILVSEWEGEYVDKFGFLKEDLLGLSQLDKFHDMFDLIKKDYDLDFKLTDIPLDDPKTFENIALGFNEDVFQFGASGLSAYTQSIVPTEVEDLNSAIALYRPGPIEMGSHITFNKVRFGEQAAKPDYMSEKITEKTSGLYIYQEQVMMVIQQLGGFSLVEADNVRRAMGKMKPELMVTYHQQFVDGAIKNGCPPEEAELIWKKLNAFALYGFNRSHSVAYALTGYYSAWLKTNFPLQFWVVSLKHADQDKLPSRLYEIGKKKEVTVVPPDINHSGNDFVYDLDTNEIFWSLTSIKFSGESSIKEILKEREEKGEFYSLDEFLSRVKVNKRTMVNLILCGAFDKVENIKQESDRRNILYRFVKSRNEQLPEEFRSQESLSNFWWIMKMKELCGIGFIDYDKVISKYSTAYPVANFQMIELVEEEQKDIYCYFGGIIETVNESKTKKGDPFGRVQFNYNDRKFSFTIWSDKWEIYKTTFLVGRLFVFSANLTTWNNKAVFQSNKNTTVYLL